MERLAQPLLPREQRKTQGLRLPYKTLQEDEIKILMNWEVETTHHIICIYLSLHMLYKGRTCNSRDGCSIFERFFACKL